MSVRGARCLCKASSARELADSSISLFGALVTGFFLEDDEFAAGVFCCEAGLLEEDWEAINGCCLCIVAPAVEGFVALFAAIEAMADDEPLASAFSFPAFPTMLLLPLFSGTKGTFGFLSTVTLSLPPSVATDFV